MSSSSSFLSWRIMRSESNMRCHSLQEITLNDRLSDSLLTSFYQHSFLLICFLGDSKRILFVRRTCFSLSFMAIKSGQWTKFYSSFFQAVAKQLHRLIACNVSYIGFPGVRNLSCSSLSRKSCWSVAWIKLFIKLSYQPLSNQPLIVFLTGSLECFFLSPTRCTEVQPGYAQIFFSNSMNRNLWNMMLLWSVSWILRMIHVPDVTWETLNI